MRERTAEGSEAQESDELMEKLIRREKSGRTGKNAKCGNSGKSAAQSRFLGMLLGAALCLLFLCGCGERLSRVETCRRAGIEAMQRGDYAGAAEQFQSAMSCYGTARQDSAGIDVLRYLAEAQYRSGDYAGAAESYERLLGSDGRKGVYLDMACVCLVKSGGDLSRAVSLYEEADQAGTSGDAHRSTLFTLGEALSASGDDALKEKAEELYQNAVSSSGETPDLFLRIGKLCFDGGDLEKAEEYFESGISRAEEELSAGAENEERTEELQEILENLRFNRAVCLEYSHQYGDALKEMEDIAAASGEEDAALMHEITFLKSRVGGEKTE